MPRPGSGRIPFHAAPAAVVRVVVRDVGPAVVVAGAERRPNAGARRISRGTLGYLFKGGVAPLTTPKGERGG